MSSNSKLRVTEAKSQELFVDINDLIIFLMKAMEATTSEGEKSAYAKVIAKLTDLRDKSNAGRK